MTGLLAALGATSAQAEMQPHRAVYTLRLGIAANAPRVGSAVQDLVRDCDGWRLDREIKGEVALTPSLKMNVSSRLDSEEQATPHAFRFRTVQTQNGAAREAKGSVARDGDELRAEIEVASGSTALDLPAATFMPASWLQHTIAELRDGRSSFAGFLFDAEGTHDAFAVAVKRADARTLRQRRPADPTVDVPGQSWPVTMTFTRRGEPAAKPLFTLTAQLFDSGVLDRLTIDAGVAVVTADLQSVDLHDSPTCR
ncbi:MAG: DUF1849 family protein [Reyranellaceae bacterium]